MKTRLLIVLIAGGLFGIGLAVSGMSNPARVIGFLDVTGKWDPSLLAVMGGAVATFGVGLALWRKRAGTTGWFGAQLPGRNVDPVNGRLVIGAVVFGLGWGLGGFCPGPAIANLALLRPDALVFVPAMAAGMWLARLVAGADAD